jgi:hypothetical protein
MKTLKERPKEMLDDLLGKLILMNRDLLFFDDENPVAKELTASTRSEICKLIAKIGGLLAQ